MLPLSMCSRGASHRRIYNGNEWSISLSWVVFVVVSRRHPPGTENEALCSLTKQRKITAETRSGTREPFEFFFVSFLPESFLTFDDDGQIDNTS